jgi:hypothetical protein
MPMGTKPEYEVYLHSNVKIAKMPQYVNVMLTPGRSIAVNACPGILFPQVRSQAIVSACTNIRF